MDAKCPQWDSSISFVMISTVVCCPTSSETVKVPWVNPAQEIQQIIAALGVEVFRASWRARENPVSSRFPAWMCTSPLAEARSDRGSVTAIPGAAYFGLQRFETKQG
jgi:hypothetical protein